MVNKSSLTTRPKKAAIKKKVVASTVNNHKKGNSLPKKKPIVIKKESHEQVNDILTSNQEQFCQNYTLNVELRRNATLTYAHVYGYDLDSADRIRKLDVKGEEIEGTSVYDMMYSVCSAASSRLLRNVKIQERCRDIIYGYMVEKNVDAKLSQLIFDAKDGVSLGGIKEFNKLKQRIIDNVKVNGDFTVSTETVQNKIERSLQNVINGCR